jgi:TonB family protein
MKKDQSDHKKRKDFIKMPEYPGGKEALGKFITDNLRYPAEAVKNQIEGRVLISFDVDHNGVVSMEKVIKGIGYGCDEEALRIVKLMIYNKTHNRGVRVKKTMRIRIDFKLPQGIRFSFVQTDAKKPDEAAVKKPDEPVVYSYTIQLGSTGNSE